MRSEYIRCDGTDYSAICSGVFKWMVGPLDFSQATRFGFLIGPCVVSTQDFMNFMPQEAHTEPRIAIPSRRAARTMAIFWYTVNEEAQNAK